MGMIRDDVQICHAGIDAKRQNAIAQHTARPHKPSSAQCLPCQGQALTGRLRRALTWEVILRRKLPMGGGWWW